MSTYPKVASLQETRTGRNGFVDFAQRCDLPAGKVVDRLHFVGSRYPKCDCDRDTPLLLLLTYVVQSGVYEGFRGPSGSVGEGGAILNEI